MNTVTATFERWAHGWELTVEGDAEVSTQATTLSRARQQVRDYLDTVDPDVDHSDWTVILKPADQALEDRVSAARQATKAAAAAQERAARESRGVVAQLASAGYKGSDIAAILDVSRGRAYQLMQDANAS